MIIYICLCLQVFSLFRCNSDECNTCWLHGLFTCNCKPTCARQPLTALRTCIQSSNWVHALLCRSLALLQWKWQHDYRVSICLCVCVCVCVCVCGQRWLGQHYNAVCSVWCRPTRRNDTWPVLYPVNTATRIIYSVAQKWHTFCTPYNLIK